MQIFKRMAFVGSALERNPALSAPRLVLRRQVLC